MEKLGLALHRYTVAIVSWFYVVIFILEVYYSLAIQFDGDSIGAHIPFLSLGFLGLFSLHKEHGTLMKVFGIIAMILAAVYAVVLIALLCSMFGFDENVTVGDDYVLITRPSAGSELYFYMCLLVNICTAIASFELSRIYRLKTLTTEHKEQLC